MCLVRTQGHILQSALPQEIVTANIARRILKLIREEFDLLKAKVGLIINLFISASYNKFAYKFLGASIHG